jgi:phospholipid-transporting ATPase
MRRQDIGAVETAAEKRKRLQKEREERDKARYSRVFMISNEEKNSAIFPSNEVQTTKYRNFLSIWRAVYDQFKRLPVAYYAAMVLLEIIRYFSPYSPIPTYVTFLFVVCLSILRDIFEDITRHRADFNINTTATVKYRDGKWQRVDWKGVYVGDILRIKENDIVPADSICLSSSNYDRMFYLQTNYLNGRTSLGKRKAVEATSQLIGNGEVYRLSGEAEMNQVSGSLNEFDGLILIGNDYDIEVSQDNFLPRGAVLRNTDWVICLVAFTGMDCKIFMNAQDRPTKTTRVEGMVNLGLFIVLGFQGGLGLMMGVLSGIWTRTYGGNYADYTGYNPPDYAAGFLGIFSFIVLTSQMMPLVIILFLEVTRMSISYFISKDELLYDEARMAYPSVLTANIVEELGQIQHMLCDKTGTLTNNKFQLKLFMIGDQLYGDPGVLADGSLAQGSDKQGRGIIKDQDEDIEYTFEDERLAKLGEYYMSDNPSIDLKVNDRTTGRNVYHYRFQLELVREYFTSIAFCNGCEVMIDQNTRETSYHSMYPDEVALVDAAKKIGFELVESGSFFKRANILGKEVYMEVLKSIKFNHLRRRSTVIVKSKGTMKLYIKGVPEVLYELMADNHPKHHLDMNNGLISSANARGLRTMGFGMRAVSEIEYFEFEKRLERAMARQVLDEREKMVNEAIDFIEQGITYLGTAICDEIVRPKVQETLADIIKADIKLWVVSGDKLQNVVATANRVQLIKDNMMGHFIGTTEEMGSKVMSIKKDIDSNPKKDHYLMAEGGFLEQIKKDKQVLTLFTNTIVPRVVFSLCFSMSSAHKYNLCNYLTVECRKVTMAVGDGYNDAEMIKQANVGICVKGADGSYAQQCCDFLIGEFKDIWRLLFVHGRWGYIRIAEMVLILFFRNAIFTAPQIAFTLYNGYSMVSLYNEWHMIFFNILFTSMPILAKSVFDQDIYYLRWSRPVDSYSGGPRIETLYNIKTYYPYLYYESQNSKILNPIMLGGWIVEGFVLGALFFLMVMNCADAPPLTIDGHMGDFWWVSITTYFIVVLVSDIKTAVFTRAWSWFNWVAIFLGSIVLLIAFIVATDYMSNFSSYKTIWLIFSSANFYLCIILSCGVDTVCSDY